MVMAGFGVLVLRKSGVRLPKAAPIPQLGAMIVPLWTVSWNERGTMCASLGVNSVLTA